MTGLRPATADDRAFLRELYATSRADLALLPPELVALQFSAQDAQYRRADASFEMIVVDGVDAGRISVQRTATETRLMDITLAPAFRGRGIGSELVRALQAEGRPVTLHVEAFNPARALYERLGFTVVQDQHGAYLSMVWTPGTEAFTCSIRS